jgi:phosphate transport system ATP-binding protein
VAGHATDKIVVRNLNAWYGDFQALKNINLSIKKNTITAILGPSGCGKSTFIRCLNRLHELRSDAKIEGEILLDGKSVFNMDPVEVRRKIGMVFQRPNPFPTMSIYDNVAIGLKLNGVRDKKALDRVVEDSLKKAALWDEVKDKLNMPGTSLSGGQQQRLCIARAIATNPEVILFDEPTSALDPISAVKIEDLLVDLKGNYTVVIVTHNIQQAGRVSDYVAFFWMGELVEFGKTAEVFENPKEELTEAYLTGRIG